ncbi:MAG: HlyD family secretion protein [Candidatus Margulisiibacteriota bacterium]
MNKKWVIGVVLCGLVAGAGTLGYRAYRYVTTDNASVEAKTTLLSAEVAGTIETVNVEENQRVKAGQVLATLRTVNYQNALNLSKADYASLAVQQRNAQTNYKRSLALYKVGAETKERVDATQAAFNALTEKLKAADAQVKQSEENFSHTEIKAPADGRVAKKSFEVGMAVVPGQPLMGFVIGDDRWVVANFKETELAGIVPGKPAKVVIDAIAHRTFEGEVESISPSTGAAFSLLPPDNAVGNFTKVVQRVPVKIRLTHLSKADVVLLQAGLSAEVSVKRR